MTTETTAAPATTEVTQTAAPTEQAQVDTQATSQVADANPASEVQTDKPDYSYVPKKFLNDGEPDWETFAKSYQNLEKKLGQKGVLVPEDPAEYEWSGQSAVHIDDTQASAFKTDAQKAGLSKEQYQFVMGKYEEIMTNSGFNPEASEAVLKNDWGDDFKPNMKLAQKAFSEFAPSDVNVNDPIFNHPTVIKLLARMGQEMREDNQTAVRGNTSRNAGMSKEEVQAIQSSPDYWMNPDKQAKVRQWYEKNYK